MKPWFNDRFRKKRGFSLAEALVVAGITAILAAVSFPAVIHVRDSLRQTELDRMARSVFIAAQNQLSGLRLCGDLPDIREEGLPMPEDAGQWPSDYKPELGARPDTYVLCDLSSGADFTWMDDTAFSPANVKSDGGSYAIEYNRSTGRVYAVFYWEPEGGTFQKDSRFSYPPDHFNQFQGKNLRGEGNKDNRREPSVGYYGGEAANLIESSEELEFQVTVRNEEDLRVDIEMSREVWENSVFEILVSSKTDGGNPVVYKYKAGRNSMELISPGETQAQDVTQASEGLYSLTLDSLRESLHFADNFPGICAGDDLKISVTGYSASGRSLYLPVTRAVEANSLFGGLRAQSGRGPQVYIENGRHLQNLSYQVSALGTKEGGRGESTRHQIVSAKLMKDIDWAEKVYEGKSLSWDQVSTSNQTWGLGLVNFYPISNDSTALQIFDGNNHSIKNLHVTRTYRMDGAGGPYGQAGLFGYFKYDRDKGTAQASISNVNLVNPLIEPAVSPGSPSYVGSLAGYLEDVSVINCSAYMDGIAAGLPGEGDWSALYESGTGVAAAAHYTGGLIGSGESIKAESSSASLKVSGGVTSGGFAGALTGSSVIEKCYSGGRTEKGAYTQERPNAAGLQTAGGFAGRVGSGVKIARSFSSCSVKAPVCGPFAGQTEASEAEQEANLLFTYGVGSAFEPEEGGGFVNSVGCGPVGEQLVTLGGARMPGAKETHPYDETYRREGQSYPYPVWLEDYYGDWQGAVFTGFVYYEKYRLESEGGPSSQEDQYGFWSPGQKDPEGGSAGGVQTLKDDEPVLSDGYGYLSPTVKEVSVQQGGKGKSHRLEALKVKHEGVDQYLYVLPWEDVIHVQITSFEENHGKKVSTFYDRLKFDIDGGTYEAYYNPHFAKAIAADQAQARRGPQRALLRTARHLYEMAFISNNGSKNNKAYWDASWDSEGVFEGYLVERDIDCEIYDGSTYEEGEAVLTQNVIGSGKAGENFGLTFDGGGHTISHLNIDDQDYGRSFRGNAAALFGYVSAGGAVKNLDIKYASITARYVLHAAGLVYTNEGTISNVRVINPQVRTDNGSGTAAGLAVENTADGEIRDCYVIPEQENYQREEDRYKHIYNGSDLVVNNYTNATVTAPSRAAGFVVTNSGLIQNCGAVGAVTAGTVESGVIIPGDNGSAAGFVNDQNKGEITNSYANCYTAGRFAAGFVNNAAGDGIRSCYSLRRVTSTYLNGYAAGFGGATNAGSTGDSYAAVSVGYCPGYRIQDGVIYYENTEYVTDETFLYPFSQYSQWLSNCYFLSWSENYEDPWAPSGLGLTYRQLKENHETAGFDKFETARSDGSDTEPFSLMLAPVYPFPKTAGMIQYGDWPSYEYVGAELTYFEVYREENRYTVGMYNENLDLDTLKNYEGGAKPPDIFLDGYALLFNEEYIEMDNVELNNLIQGTSSSNSEAYLTWEDNVGSDNTTSSATNYLKSVYSLVDNEGRRLRSADLGYYNNVTGEEAAFEGEAGSDRPIELSLSGRAGRYYFRILPPAAVVTNAYVPEDSVYQPLEIHVKSNYEDEGGGGRSEGQKVEKTRVFYYTPHFAKSAISVGQRPDEPSRLLVRTVRQLCTLGSGNVKNGRDSIGRYYDKTFLQEYDIPLGKEGAYAYHYSDTAPMASGSTYRNRHNYRWFNSSIGSQAYPFKGVYDGGGYTISGLGSWKGIPSILTQSPFGGIGSFNRDTPLFGYLTGRVGAIEEQGTQGSVTRDNLVIDASRLEGSKSILCAVSEGGILQGVTVKNSALVPGSGSAGILLGEGTEQPLVTACTVADSAVECSSGDYSYIGIAAGYINGPEAEITGLKITDSSVKAPEGAAENNATRLGGVTGYISGGKISHVELAGNITVQGRRGVGAIAGQILSNKGEVLISDILITGTADISQLKANHGSGENLYTYNGAGLVAGLGEIGYPVTLDNLTFHGSGQVTAQGDGLLKVKNGSQCHGYVGGLLIGSLYRNGNSGVKELILGNVSIENGGLYTDRTVSAPDAPRCYYGGIAGRAANVNVSPRSADNLWDFGGGLMAVEPERIHLKSGISGLVGSYVTSGSLTLPGQVKLPHIRVTVSPGSSVPVGGILNSSAAGVRVEPAPGITARVELGEIITENCDNTGGLTALLSDNTAFGSHIALLGGRIQTTGNGGAAAGSINTKGRLANISVDNVTVTGNGSLGGFAGVLDGGVIENCYANAAVTGDGSSPTGGFAGTIRGGTIRKSYASGFVTGRSGVGGFFGTMTKSGAIESCYATGNVYELPASGTGGAIGGFGGSLAPAGGAVSIAQCYSLGRVPENPADMDAGGFIGKTEGVKDDFKDLDQMIGSLISIMKSAEIHNRPVGNGENGKTVWNISQTMDSSTVGALNSAGGGYSAAVYNILGYPRYHSSLMAGMTAGRDTKADSGALLSAYSGIFDGSGRLIEQTEPESYYQRVYKPSMEKGLMTLWQIKGRYLYWINDRDWALGKSCTAYRVNLDQYAAAADPQERKNLVETRSLDVVQSPTASYGEDYMVLSTRTDGWQARAMPSVSRCYFLKEDGAQGVPQYNGPYGPVDMGEGGGIDDWTVAEFAAELAAEAQGGGMLKDMKPDVTLWPQQAPYPYPILENTGAGVAGPYHSGYWPGDYRPAYP